MSTDFVGSGRVDFHGSCFSMSGPASGRLSAASGAAHEWTHVCNPLTLKQRCGVIDASPAGILEHPNWGLPQCRRGPPSTAKECSNETEWVDHEHDGLNWLVSRQVLLNVPFNAASICLASRSSVISKFDVITKEPLSHS